MKKITSLILDRTDLKPGFLDIPFNKVTPYLFHDNIVKKIDKTDVVIFVNTVPISEFPDKRTKVLKNNFGLWGVVTPLTRL